ncbi:tetratricopeptide repeat protein [Aliidiomarina sanyensis]|uniref:MalT-like TPR region domain-containing protein n=1 Tax=Aliidiomarina sanyensis TaxID=1249555 RepID=A0A432WNP0_9GAMM|nr:tetratricopeptide repeat protein [Aliidiomarina sanyensis]RUO35413.1 hypothetical protein CWE11_05225 [Aliidiomarina sanyensis]
MDFQEALIIADKHYKSGEYEAALSYFSAIAEFLEDGEPAELEGDNLIAFSMNMVAIYNNMALCLDHLGQQRDAIQHYVSAFERIEELMESIQDEDIIRKYHHNAELVAQALLNLGNSVEAFEFLEDVLEETERYHKREQTPFSSAAVAHVHEIMAKIWLELGDPDAAFDCAMQMLAEHQRQADRTKDWRDEVDLSRAHLLLGEITEILFQHQEARKHFEAALKGRLLQQEKHPGYDANYNILVVYERLGRLMVELREFAAAQKYLDTATAIYEDNRWREGAHEFRLFANLFADLVLLHQLQKKPVDAYREQAKFALQWLEENNEMDSDMQRVEAIIGTRDTPRLM